MKCEQARELIAAWREGWLPAEWATAIDGHVRSCCRCQESVRADRKLCTLLSELSQVEAEPPSLEHLLAATLPARRRLPRWIMAPALAAASASAALLWITAVRPGGGRQPSVAIRSEVTPSAARIAHLMMAAAQPGSDPNRAIIVYYSIRTEP